MNLYRGNSMKSPTKLSADIVNQLESLARGRTAKNWRLRMFLTTAVIIIIVLVASGAYLVPPDRELQSQRGKTITPARSPSHTFFQPPAGWQTYKSEEYKFQISYPQDWGRTTDIAECIRDPTLPYPSRHLVNLITVRTVGLDMQSQYFTIVVYEKPPTSALTAWLSIAYGSDLAKIEKGNIDTALSRAYAGKKGIVSNNELKERDTTVQEVGEVVLFGVLSYSTYFAREGLPYVYEITIDLEFEQDEHMVDPPDSTFVKLYNQIVSSFKLAD
jgi:hypothetical protein